ncbi:MAG: hypothetical protein RIR79_1174 [Pseudomonadota bacterium]
MGFFMDQNWERHLYYGIFQEANIWHIMTHTPLDHQPLFNARLIARSGAVDAVPPAHQQVLTDWAAAIRNQSIYKQKEQQIRSAFVQKIFCDILGYSTFGSGNDGAYTLADENYVGRGRVDVVLGRFGNKGIGEDKILVPFELKGADTPDLDVMMSGRFKSPVQQVWEYAMDVPHAKFLLLTNMLEIRLYAVGHTRRVYERFDLVEIANNPVEYHRFQLLLGINNLLGGRTLELLNESGAIEKQITRELYADYKNWRIQLIIALAQANQANNSEPKVFIAPVQKLLDRILFVAFAQQRGLLPTGTLKSVHTQKAWKKIPLWENYQALFEAVDKGLPERGVPPYNGGLFAPDAFLDNLIVPDSACDIFQEFGKYDFGGEVSVNVLGHIFEQSISDLEELQNLADMGAFTLDSLVQSAASKTSVSGARKEHGIVYTPEFITAFIVDQTLGKTLDRARSACIVSYQNTSDWRKPTAEEKRYAKTLKQPARVVELLFWRAWLAELSAFKICDPACGSGAFLVAVFDILRAEYASINAQISAIMGNMDVFDADKTILNGNLYGVDLNAESIEITKLSLWLKTAQYGKPLESLESHLRVGNSLVQTNFDWNTAFPEVTAQGGFDIIVGNPPYVRQERISPFKPYLEKNYSVFNGGADLYAYFFEQGIRLLRPETGRLGFISSGTFFKTSSGAPLRKYLLENTQLESIVDFGDVQVFEGVTTYPVIMTMRRTATPDSAHDIRFLAIQNKVPTKLNDAFKEKAAVLMQGQLNTQSWQLEDSRLNALRKKIMGQHPTLKEVYGSPLYGIKTGLNNAFVIDATTHKRLISEDPRSAELLKPFLEGKDLKRWHYESQDLWLIFTRRGVDIDKYPAIKAHLQNYHEKLLNRSSSGHQWHEISSVIAYYENFNQPKMIWADISKSNQISFDDKAYHLADTCFFLPTNDMFVLALLNSTVMEFIFKALSTMIRGGFYRYKTQYVETLPIPPTNKSQKEQLANFAKTAQTAAEARFLLLKKFNHSAVRDFAQSGKMPAAWSDALPSFAVFTAELKKRFKRDLNLQERNDWDTYLAQTQTRINELNQIIIQAERQIDALVAELFGLTEEEKALLG